MFDLLPLPYEKDALEPHMSKDTLEFHYGKHHKTYVDTTNKLIQGTEYENTPLAEIIKKTADAKDEETKKIFNNSAQVWNHTFFWSCMKKNGGGKPEGEMLTAIEDAFGSYDKFREEFKTAATGQFGSGWAWLVKKDGKLSIMKTSNADTPIAHDIQPVLTIDVWEHAYYLDYQNKRPEFVDVFLDNLVNWEFASNSL